MKILTFNIWDLPIIFVKQRQERILKIAEYLKFSGMDIICLQESFDVKHRLILNRTLSVAGYNATDETLENRRILFFKKMDCTGGLVLFSKYPIIENVFIPFNRLLNASIFEYFGRKGFLMTVLDTPYGKIRIVNTHLHSGNTIFDRKFRFWQLKKILDYLDRQKDSLPVIFAGDLNEHSDFLEEKFFDLLKKDDFAFFDKESLQPSYRIENPYVKVWINLTFKSKRFDYIFYKGIDSLGLSIEKSGIVCLDEPLSDHDPVVLLLKK